jgi:hypothetical protein
VPSMKRDDGGADFGGRTGAAVTGCTGASEIGPAVTNPLGADVVATTGDGV